MWQFRLSRSKNGMADAKVSCYLLYLVGEKGISRDFHVESEVRVSETGFFQVNFQHRPMGHKWRDANPDINLFENPAPSQAFRAT